MCHGLGHGQGYGEDGATPIRAVRGSYGAVHRLDEPSGNCQAQSGSRAYLIALAHAIELVEDALDVGDGNSLSFIEHLQADLLAVAPALKADGRLRWSVLCSIVEQIEQ